MKRLIILVIVLIVISLGSKTLEDRDIEIISEVLERSGLDLSSLNFLKDWSGSTAFKLPQTVEILNNPLEYPIFVDKLASAMKSDNREELSDLVMNVLAYETTEDYQKLAESYHHQFELEYLYEVHGTTGLVKYVEKVWDNCEIERKLAFRDCRSSDEAMWRYLSTGLWSEAEDSLAYNAYYEKYEIEEYEEIDSDSLKAMIKRIDLSALFRAAMINRAGFEVMMERLDDSNLEIEEETTYESRYGLMRIGSSGSDIVEEDYVFCFDPGGDDSYLGRMETDWSTQPYFWQLDLAGNDQYHNAEIAGMLSARGGIALLADLGGNDVYRGSDYSVSSFWGYSELIDREGDDIYSFGLHSGGAATFGISLLVDYSGEDSYRVTQYGEGFGSTLGFGAVIDYSGFDNYYAGGKYMHAPLAPLDYRSLSQGFGFGMRPDLGGGIGMIYDQSGNDNYTGGVYSQAVAYWYALGIIYDEEGYDYYDSVYYPQGSGIHLAAGFLYDGAGEDHYYSKHGPGQGAAHDWAVGYLIDRSGNDHYSVEGGNGAALTNSVVIFLDGAGNDNYQRKEVNNYGYSRPARSTGGIGIFLDTGGKDRYPVEICGNDSFWCRGYYGIGLDTLLVEEEKEISRMNDEQAAEVDSLAKIEEIWELAAGWGVGSNQATVQRASEILINRSEEAAKYIGENQLGTKSGLAYRAISSFNEKSDSLVPYLLENLSDEDSLVAKHCISLIGEKNDSTYIEQLQPFLEADKYTRSVLGALGEIECDESVKILSNYRDSNSEKVRYVVAASLKGLKREDSEEALLEMAEDKSFLIRTLVKMHQAKKENK